MYGVPSALKIASGANAVLSSSTVATVTDASVRVTFSGMALGFIYEAYCSMRDVVSAKTAVMASSVALHPRVSFLGATSVTLSVAFSGTSGVSMCNYAGNKYRFSYRG